MYNRCNSSLGNSTLRTGKGVQYEESKNNTSSNCYVYCAPSNCISTQMNENTQDIEKNTQDIEKNTQDIEKNTQDIATLQKSDSVFAPTDSNIQQAVNAYFGNADDMNNLIADYPGTTYAEVIDISNWDTSQVTNNQALHRYAIIQK